MEETETQTKDSAERYLSHLAVSLLAGNLIHPWLTSSSLAWAELGGCGEPIVHTCKKNASRVSSLDALQEHVKEHTLHENVVDPAPS